MSYPPTKPSLPRALRYVRLQQVIYTVLFIVLSGPSPRPTPRTPNAHPVRPPVLSRAARAAGFLAPIATLLIVPQTRSRLGTPRGRRLQSCTKLPSQPGSAASQTVSQPCPKPRLHCVVTPPPQDTTVEPSVASCENLTTVSHTTSLALTPSAPAETSPALFTGFIRRRPFLLSLRTVLWERPGPAHTAHHPRELTTGASRTTSGPSQKFSPLPNFDLSSLFIRARRHSQPSFAPRSPLLRQACCVFRTSNRVQVARFSVFGLTGPELGL